MTKSINVAVAQGTTFIRWARNRPARTLPNGYLGAVFNGLAMPVYRHRLDSLCIDIEDGGYDPEECPFWNSAAPFLFIDDGEDEGETEEINWYLESNAYGHYVVFDGNEDLLNDLLRRLAFRAIPVRRYGTSHRPADNGYHYDWFIRLDFDGSREEAENAVAAALLGPQSEISSAEVADIGEAFEPFLSLPSSLIVEAIQEGMMNQDTSSLISWLGEITDTARSDIERIKIDLQEEIDEVTSRADILQKNYAELKRVSAIQNSKHEKSIKSQKSEISSLSRRLEESNADISNIAALEAENSRLKSDLEEQDSIYEEWERLQKSNSDLEAKLVSARQETQTLSSENQRLLGRGAKRVRSSDKLLRFAAAALKAFSEIDIHGDAADTITERFHNPSSLFDILLRLNNGEQVASKSITTARGWLEVTKHINTGQSNMGRLYFKKQDTDRLFVVVHHKKDDSEQQRFFNKLRDPSFSRDLSFDQR